jgi:hypothetical protein
MESNAEFIKMIEKLAKKFGFDVKEAKAFVTEKSGHESDTSSDKVKLSPIEKARKNLKVWGEKLTANKFKDDESKSKHEEKIAKEQAKLDKLESAEVKPAPVKGKGKAKKEEVAKTESKPTPKKGKGKKEEVVETESKKEEVETKTESKPEVTPKKGKKTEEAPMAPKKGKKEEAEKRIKRMSPTLQKQLAEVLSRAHLEASEERKRAFLVFIEGLTDDEFKAKGLIDHMRDFAKSANDAAGPDWGGGGGGGPQFDAAPKEEAAKDERDATTVSLEDLQAIKTTATIEPVGTYWDADAGRYVKGPDADADEDCDVVSFEGKEYGVGEKTGRVYLEVNNKDVFQGFIGVGKFKTMSRT